MKNIYLFFIFLLISGCSNDNSRYITKTPISCPSILFSSEHKIYIGSSAPDISLENIEYRGEINNAIFPNECSLKNSVFSSEFSILFILEPLIDNNNLLEIPFYVAILDEKKELQDMLYFLASGKFKKDPQTNKLIETDIIKTIILENQNINESSIIVIGYVLDKKKIDILN